MVVANLDAHKYCRQFRFIGPSPTMTTKSFNGAPSVRTGKGGIRLTDTSRGGTRLGLATRTTKSHANRSIVIMPALEKLLRRLTRHRDGRVIHGPHGGRLSTNTVRNTLIAKLIEPLASRFPTPEDEIGFRDGRVHSFRHYFCSSCADVGVPREMLMKMLSHKDSPRFVS
jgi:integrase